MSESTHKLYTPAEAAIATRLRIETFEARTKHLGMVPPFDDADLARIAKPFVLARRVLRFIPDADVLAAQDRLDARPSPDHTPQS